MSNDFGVKIKKMRKNLLWTQNFLAKKAGVTKSAISLIEGGVNTPSLVVFQRISNAFGLTMSELAGEAPPPDNEKLKLFYQKNKEMQDLSKKNQEVIKYLISRLKD